MNKSLQYCIPFLLLILCFMPPISSTHHLNISTDTTSLLALKFHIAFFNPQHFLTQNWTIDSSVCDWHGVTCAHRHHRVASLNISNMALHGTIPPVIGNLSFLSHLDLHDNNFDETLPLELSHLQRLKFLDLSLNDFIGDVPSWIGTFPRLEYLSLANNTFSGSLPPSVSNISTLQTLDAAFNQLGGNIPENIGELRNLKHLNLSYNRLTGPVPPTIFHISGLETVDLTSNGLTGNFSSWNMCRYIPGLREMHLSGNMLSGRILSGLHQCWQLQILILSDNKFVGPIPREIGNLNKLQILILNNNNLKGEIPPAIGNMSSLEVLQIKNASLTGPIPSELGKLTHLRVLALDSNTLRHSIPASIFNISTLEAISLTSNNISGTLPPTICHTRNLEIVYLGENDLTGKIPDCISNISKLVAFELAYNRFTGSIPASLGNLRSLQLLNLASNNLTAESSPQGLRFISSLTNCVKLTFLAISYNRINGKLPPSIGNFSALEYLYARHSGLVGEIPDEIGNLSNVVLLSLNDNALRGAIPKTIKRLRFLNIVYLHRNQLQGSIPMEFCSMKNLFLLYLSLNNLTGCIPTCLGNSTSLKYLHLASNMLSSDIPESLLNLNELQELNLSANSLTGSVPPDIGRLKVAVRIDLGTNQLSGVIPSGISDMQSLVIFSVAHNKLEGTIPESFGQLTALEQLDLSQNNLVGVIPKSLEELKYLRYLNVSFNRLTGEIPRKGQFLTFTYDSFMSNEALCGDPWLPPCRHNISVKESHKKKVPLAVIISLPIITILFFTITALALLRRKKSRITQVQVPEAAAYQRVSYYELLTATNGFSESNLLGTGSVGSVYEGKFSNGTVLAVKVFNLNCEGAYTSFDKECEVLRNLRHRNLTKVISSCSNLDFRALVLEYMPNGSLEKWLYSHNYFLDIMKRLDVMVDVAEAMEYLHHGNSTPVIHCDLKPSNILLDENMTAHVSDFGLSKLFGLGEFIAHTHTLATIGYIAPEYGSKGLVSTSSDVYSYGILLMETFSRKRPTDEMFAEDLTLKGWIARFCHADIVCVVDENLIMPTNENLNAKLRCVGRVMELALKCCAELPEERINMKDALVSLKKIRTQYHQVCRPE